MDIQTGRFYEEQPDGRVFDVAGREIPKEQRIGFAIGEEIKIKGQPFVVASVDIAMHRLILKSKKRFSVQGKDPLEPLAHGLERFKEQMDRLTPNEEERTVPPDTADGGESGA